MITLQSRLKNDKKINLSNSNFIKIHADKITVITDEEWDLIQQDDDVLAGNISVIKKKNKKDELDSSTNIRPDTIQD